MMTERARVLDLHLQLMDRQVVDRQGRFVCKIDDLEFDLDDRGTPFVAAILVGPRALGPRLGGRLGRWVAAIAQRLADDDNRTPPRIAFEQVSEIGSAVKLACLLDDLDVDSLEHWVDRYVIGRIPGARHESE